MAIEEGKLKELKSLLRKHSISEASKLAGISLGAASYYSAKWNKEAAKRAAAQPRRRSKTLLSEPLPLQQSADGDEDFTIVVVRGENVGKALLRASLGYLK